jgi:hypothetical protein
MPHLSNDQITKTESAIKLLLHASRDCLRNRKEMTPKIRFRVQCGYYGEAFGIMRGLALLDYGWIDGAVNRVNLRHWFDQLCDEVLTEENYGDGYGDGSGRCLRCLDRYGKDDSVMRASTTTRSNTMLNFENHWSAVLNSVQLQRAIWALGELKNPSSPAEVAHCINGRTGFHWCIAGAGRFFRLSGRQSPYFDRHRFEKRYTYELTRLGQKLFEEMQRGIWLGVGDREIGAKDEEGTGNRGSGPREARLD